MAGVIFFVKILHLQTKILSSAFLLVKELNFGCKLDLFISWGNGIANLCMSCIITLTRRNSSRYFFVFRFRGLPLSIDETSGTSWSPISSVG